MNKIFFAFKSSEAGDSQSADEPRHQPRGPDHDVFLTHFISDVDEPVLGARESSQGMPGKGSRKHATHEHDTAQMNIGPFPQN